jgi:hypothetical protein
MVVYLYKKGRQTMKNIITTIAMFILTITAQAQTYKMGKMVEKTFENTMEYFQADSLGLTKVVDSIFTQSDVFVGKNKVTFKSQKSKKVFKITETILLTEQLDMYLVTDMKTKKSYSMYIGKDNEKAFFLFQTYSEDMKNVNVITSESI